ncbi:hypothetical protein HZC20_03170 [Candidatus Peregrinibacteria bacterium]|nr:hypothetical protein [Candidatus Peregrinibacteria bacterium]
MKIRNFKPWIVPSVIAVLSGVLFLGVNTTIGAPTYSPPGSAVSPTFNGINLTGPIANPSGSVIAINSAIDVNGSGVAGSGNVTIKAGNLDVWGNIVNTKKNLISINGQLILQDPPGFNPKDPLASSFSATIASFQIVKNPASFNGVPAPLQVDDDLNVIGNASVVKDLSVTGNTVSTGSIIAGGGLGSTSGLTIAGTGVFYGDVVFGKTISGAIPSGGTQPLLNVNGDLKVWNKVTAKAFGTYNLYWGSGTNVAAGAPGTMSSTCPSGQVLVGCTFTADRMLVTRLDRDASFCYVDATNNTAFAQWLNVKSTCLDPTK